MQDITPHPSGQRASDSGVTQSPRQSDPPFQHLDSCRRCVAFSASDFVGEPPDLLMALQDPDWQPLADQAPRTSPLTRLSRALTLARQLRPAARAGDGNAVAADGRGSAREGVGAAARAAAASGKGEGLVEDLEGLAAALVAAAAVEPGSGGDVGRDWDVRRQRCRGVGPFLGTPAAADVAEYHRRIVRHIQSPEYRARAAAAAHGGRGILIPAGGSRYLTNLIVSLRVLRTHLNCTLPVEVAWQGPGEMDAPTLASLERHFGPLRGFDAQSTPHPVRGLHGDRFDASSYSGKVYALAMSSFSQVLLLDADSLPLMDPSPLFDDPRFVAHGSLFWPDAWTGLVQDRAFGTYGIDEGKAKDVLSLGRGTGRRDSESGQLLLDRSRHLDMLEALLLINRHPDANRGMLWGDKDTYWLAFALVGKAHCFNQVTVPPSAYLYWAPDKLLTKATGAVGPGWVVGGFVQNVEDTPYVYGYNATGPATANGDAGSGAGGPAGAAAGAVPTGIGGPAKGEAGPGGSGVAVSTPAAGGMGGPGAGAGEAAGGGSGSRAGSGEGGFTAVAARPGTDSAGGGNDAGQAAGAGGHGGGTGGGSAGGSAAKDVASSGSAAVAAGTTADGASSSLPSASSSSPLPPVSNAESSGGNSIAGGGGGGAPVARRLQGAVDGAGGASSSAASATSSVPSRPSPLPVAAAGARQVATGPAAGPVAGDAITPTGSAAAAVTPPVLGSSRPQINGSAVSSTRVDQAVGAVGSHPGGGSGGEVAGAGSGGGEVAGRAPRPGDALLAALPGMVRPAFLHRTINKLRVDEEPHLLEALTAPMTQSWASYYVYHDNPGPTRGVPWDYVAPEAALRMLAATSDPPTGNGSAAASGPQPQPLGLSWLPAGAPRQPGYRRGEWSEGEEEAGKDGEADGRQFGLFHMLLGRRSGVGRGAAVGGKSHDDDDDAGGAGRPQGDRRGRNTKRTCPHVGATAPIAVTDRGHTGGGDGAAPGSCPYSQEDIELYLEVLTAGVPVDRHPALERACGPSLAAVASAAANRTAAAAAAAARSYPAAATYLAALARGEAGPLPLPLSSVAPLAYLDTTNKRGGSFKAPADTAAGGSSGGGDGAAPPPLPTVQFDWRNPWPCAGAPFVSAILESYRAYEWVLRHRREFPMLDSQVARRGRGGGRM